MSFKFVHKGEPHPWKEEGMPNLGARVGSKRGGSKKGKSLGGTRDESFEAFSLQPNLCRGLEIKGVSYGPNGEVRCANRAAARELAKANNDVNPHAVLDYDD